LVARDPEASAYVRKLEEQLADGSDEDEDDEDEEIINLDGPVSTGPLPSADSVIRNVEEMLRNSVRATENTISRMILMAMRQNE